MIVSQNTSICYHSGETYGFDNVSESGEVIWRADDLLPNRTAYTNLNYPMSDVNRVEFDEIPSESEVIPQLEAIAAAIGDDRIKYVQRTYVLPNEDETDFNGAQTIYRYFKDPGFVVS